MIERQDIRTYRTNEDGTELVKRLAINATPAHYTLWFFEEATGNPVAIGEYSNREEADRAFDALLKLVEPQQKDI